MGSVLYAFRDSFLFSFQFVFPSIIFVFISFLFFCTAINFVFISLPFYCNRSRFRQSFSFVFRSRSGNNFFKIFIHFPSSFNSLYSNKFSQHSNNETEHYFNHHLSKMHGTNARSIYNNLQLNIYNHFIIDSVIDLTVPLFGSNQRVKPSFLWTFLLSLRQMRIANDFFIALGCLQVRLPHNEKILSTYASHLIYSTVE